MGRKLKKAKKEEIERLIPECLQLVGIKETKEEQVNLLLRLIMSTIGNYFFKQPDNLIEVGFLRFKKNPEKDDLFTVEIIRSKESGIENAETLWRYYTGELNSEKQLKKVIKDFVDELMIYSQNQEEEITNLTRKLQ